MLAAKRWTVTIEIDEHDGRTRAHARLHTQDSDQLVGVGLARLNPVDRDVPEIGDEVAAARALSDLAHHLLDAAGADVEDAVARFRQAAAAAEAVGSVRRRRSGARQPR